MPSNTGPSMESNMEPERDHRLPAAEGVDSGASVNSGASAPAAAGYETRDANTSGVLLFLALLAATVALVMLFSWRLFRQYSVAIGNNAARFAVHRRS